MKAILYNKNVIFISIFIVLISLLCVKISIPPYGHHSFRQTQTISTIQDYYFNGINLLYPKTHYAGYPGYHVLEFPLYQALIAIIWKIFLPSIVLIRIINILFFFINAFLIYKIVLYYYNKQTAIFSFFVFLFIPLNLIYYRSTLFDPSAIFLNLSLIYIYITFKDLNSLSGFFKFILFTFLIIIAAIMKPLYLFPFVIIFFFTFFKKSSLLKIFFLFSIVISLFVLYLWMNHAKFVNSTNFFTSQLTIGEHLGFGKLISSGFWKAIFFRLVTRYAPGPLLCLLLFSMVPIFCKNVFQVQYRNHILINWIIIIGYLFIFANINRPHDYYQLILMPNIAFLIALLIQKIITLLKEKDHVYIFLLILFISTIISSTIYYMQYLKNNPNITELKERITIHIEKDAEYILLFRKRNKYIESPDGPTALFALNCKGKSYMNVKDVNEAINIITTIPVNIRTNFNALVFYNFEKISSETKNELIKLGFIEQSKDKYVVAYKRTDNI